MKEKKESLQAIITVYKLGFINELTNYIENAR